MHLWSEYEGKTIAGAYNLKKLLRSEGRNAFFTTSDRQKDGAVIRLTEAHFDEEEMLKRWRQVAAVDQHNLLAIREVGQTKVDDVAVAYALLEPNDGNLAEVLRERPLTPAEALQVASSVVGALAVLHANGLVHEQVQTANILAVGETVKLRSDCVRECVADQEFTTSAQCDELRLRDIHDLGTVLLQCLTLEPEWKPTLRLPHPFAQLIPGALDGSWSLDRMASVLTAAEEATNRKTPAMVAPAVVAPPPMTPSVHSAPGQSSPPSTDAQRAVPASSARYVPSSVRNGTGSTAPKSVAGIVPSGAASSPPPVVPAKVFEPAATQAAAVQPGGGTVNVDAASSLAGRLSQRRHIVAPEQPRFSAWKWMLGCAVVIALLLVWRFSGRGTAAPVAASPAISAAPSPALAHAPAAPAEPLRSVPSTVPAQSGKAAESWYVVAYTYNHKDQADAKVVSLKRIHNSLHPRVFSPSGQAPYLITLGGPMSHQQAGDMLKHAHRAGLPRDTFLRNY